VCGPAGHVTSCDETNDAAATTNARGHLTADEQRLHLTHDCRSAAHVVVPALLMLPGYTGMCVHHYDAFVVL